MAFFEKDWFMRQLKIFVDMAASLVMGKAFEPYQLTDPDVMTTADTLHTQVVTLLQEGDASGAEDLLFEHIDPEDPEVFHVGLDFYNRLNEFSDDQLEEMDFSREEIKDGVRDMASEYGCEGILDELKLSWNQD